MKLNSILESYLDGSIVTNLIKGGRPVEDQKQIDQALREQKLQNQLLTNRLEKNSQFNNKLIIVCVVVLLLSFCLICYLIWYFLPGNEKIVLGLMSGEGVSILFIVRTLHRLYKDKVFSDLMLYRLPYLTTEEEKRDFIKAILEFTK